MTDSRTSLFDRAGGEATFFSIVDRFYEGVESDAVLRPLYVEDDLAGARRRLALFLIQYFGGPQTYREERGHPRLRARHLPFSIGIEERDAWLRLMRASVAKASVDDEVRKQLLDYFDHAATFLMNKQVVWPAG